MTPERYSQVKSLFQLVLDQPPQQRAEFLDRACGADRQLFKQVRELLQADSTSESFLEKPAITPISKVLADADADLQDAMPPRIGPYATHKLLGSGGMGAVYLASRADQSFNKQVAIKVIHKGMDSDRILQRFRRERQIVASLDHPNIARLLDGGATDDARPYIVMEYVEGMPIDAWCDHQRLPARQRLELFLQLCDAIHYAHQNLIIHRDIKPGNILVRADGTAKLLDFGIAKLITPDSSAAPSEKTATSMRLMTPQYASPEQLKGDAVTTATDVYLLGVLLYELLTGHRPYDTKETATLEAVNAYTQSEPQNPSLAIFRIAERCLPNGQKRIVKNALSVAAARGTMPAVLQKTLQGDLDAILLRSLRRVPAERYQSVAQFAQDIRNHLQLLPVSAQPDTPAYRARLFLRRNTRLATAAAAAVSLLFVITVFAIWQTTRARAEHARADARFSEVNKLSNALLFDVQDALAPLPGALPARRALVNKAVEYLNNVATQSASDATLQRELAAAYLRLGHLQGNPDSPNLGDTTGALASYRRSASLLEPLHQAHPADPQIANALAAAHESQAGIFAFYNDSPPTIAALRRAVALRDTANAPAAAKIAANHNLAVALAAAGSSAEALPLAEKTHQLALSLTGPDAPRLHALSHTRLATVLRHTGNAPRAAESYRAAIRLYQQVAPRPNRELSFALEALAGLDPAAPQHPQARRDGAIETFRQLVALDPDNTLARHDLALAWRQQANVQSKAGNANAALASSRQFLQTAIDWTQRDPANPYAKQMLAAAHLQLAETLPRAGDREAAVNAARSAIVVLDSLLAKDKEHIIFLRDRALAQWTLGRALMELAAATNEPAPWQDAENQFRRAAEMYRSLPGDNAATAKAIAAQLETCRQNQSRLRNK